MGFIVKKQESGGGEGAAETRLNESDKSVAEKGYDTACIRNHDTCSLGEASITNREPEREWR